MKCKACGSFESKVLESRTTDDNSIKRRRECLKCGFRWTTFETAIAPAFVVCKKSGKREQFDREKLTRGLLRACQKRNVSIEVIESVVDFIEANIASTGKKEVESTVIGDLVLQKLKETDDIAYIRFASVYKNFDNKCDFIELIGDECKI